MAWIDTIFKFLGHARYNAITPSLTSGETVEAQCDERGRLLVSTEPINTQWADSGVATAERVVKGSPGKLHMIFGRNVGSSDGYVFVFNHAAAGAGRPANGSAAYLFLPIKVGTGEGFSIELPRARGFSQGLYWGVSSTDSTFTFASSARFTISTEYE